MRNHVVCEQGTASNLAVGTFEQANDLSSSDLSSSSSLLPSTRFAVVSIVLVSSVWLGTRLAMGVAFTPWQASYLHGMPIAHSTAELLAPLPLVSRLISVLLSDIPGIPPLLVHNLSSLLFGVFCCSCVAILGVLVADTLGIPENGVRALLGFEAGLLFMLTPLLTYEATAASPATLTVTLALLSCILLHRVPNLPRSRAIAATLFSGVTSGLATANHPSFFLLTFVLFLTILLRNRPEQRTGTLAFIFVLSALPGLLLPLLFSAIKGETLQEFLSHALRTPYFTIGDAAPAFGFARILEKQIPLGLLVFVPLSGILFFTPRMRGFAFFGLVMFALFGPFLPSLTNNYGADEIVRDRAAPSIFLLAWVSLFCGLGMLILIEALSARARIRWILHLVLCSTILFTMAQNCPSRRHAYAQKLATALLNYAQPDAIMLAENDLLLSLLLTTQATDNYRTDVDILSPRALSLTHLRPAVARLASDRYALSDLQTTAEQVNSWRSEQPWLVDALVSQRGHHGSIRYKESLLDLNLWQFVKENIPRRTICLAGYAPDWLTARTRPCGLVLKFPNDERVLEKPLQSPQALFEEGERTYLATRDRGIAESLPPLLVSLSGNARKWGNWNSASQFAEYAVRFDPHTPGTRLPGILVAARRGDQERALNEAAYFLALSTENDSSEYVAKLIARELEVWAYEQKMTDLFASRQNNSGWYHAFLSLAAVLWHNYEFKKLEECYSLVLQEKPDDAFSMYQLAAVYAQFGNLPQAQQWLLKALERAPGLVAANLRDDGRFVLLNERKPELSP